MSAKEAGKEEAGREEPRGPRHAPGGGRRILDHFAAMHDQYFKQNPMRGFDYRGLGPHQGGEAIGGELAWVASVEALYPLLTRYNPFRGKEETTVKGVFFVEAGNLLPESSDGLLDDFRLSAGAGVEVAK